MTATPTATNAPALLRQRQQLFLSALPVVALGWLLIAFVDPDPAGPTLETIPIGLFFGTMFGHATLAAAWNAFGPLPLIWRFPLSLVWVAMLPVAIAVNVAVNGGPDEAAVVIGVCLLGQWLLVQLPLWGLALRFGLRLRHLDDAGSGYDPRELQFGIRQLMILTAIVAVVLGISRLLVVNLGTGFRTGGEFPIFVFLAVTAIAITVPLLLAVLLPRRSMLATILVLVVIGVATAWEFPLLRRFHAGPGPQVWPLAAVNVFTAGWILLLGMIVRRCGYRLARREWSAGGVTP